MAEPSLLQSPFWGEVKRQNGWTPLFPAVSFNHGADHLSDADSDGNIDVNGLMILHRRLIPGISLAYVPHGDPAGEDPRALARLSARLKSFLPGDTICIRWDLPWTRNLEGSDEFPPLDPFFSRAVTDVQPPQTVIIDLSRDEDTLLGEMKAKTRYNIKLAFRKGVVVRQEGPDALDQWYRLYEETSRRDRIAIHPRSYYASIFDLVAVAQDPPELLLYMARYKETGEALAGIIVSRYRGRATYLYGASSNSRRNLMPAYALQWTAMKEAKAAGCGKYDLFGIPPADDPDHPMHGLYRFKTGFGGALVRRPGCQDYPLRPLRYGLYRFLEKLRRWYYLDFRKRRS